MTDILAERIAQPDLATLPEWQVADILNTPHADFGEAAQPIAVVDVREILMLHLTPDETMPSLIAIEDVSENSDHPARVAAKSARFVLEKLTTINMTDPRTAAMVHFMLAGLIDAEIITTETREKLLALGKRFRSWAEVNGMEVTPQKVGAARPPVHQGGA